MAGARQGGRTVLKVTVAERSGARTVRKPGRAAATGGAASAKKPLTRPGPRDAPVAMIRAWARTVGFDVPERGPLRAEVTRAWRSAKREKP